MQDIKLSKLANMTAETVRTRLYTCFASVECSWPTSRRQIPNWAKVLMQLDCLKEQRQLFLAFCPLRVFTREGLSARLRNSRSPNMDSIRLRVNWNAERVIVPVPAESFKTGTVADLLLLASKRFSSTRCWCF